MDRGRRKDGVEGSVVEVVRPDDRRIGIELPLRVLVWREDNVVRLGYNDPGELADAYDVEPHRAILDQMATLLDAVTTRATGA